MTFEQWWLTFSKKFSLDDADSLRSDFFRCWEEAYDAGKESTKGDSYWLP